MGVFAGGGPGRRQKATGQWRHGRLQHRPTVRHRSHPAEEGLQGALVEFNDYVQPNLALADGLLDANFFQHEVYFNQFKGDRKLDLTA
jgi:ABC-type metal ion transport system substrate-binding protein